jgi:hypothetical protein
MRRWTLWRRIIGDGDRGSKQKNSDTEFEHDFFLRRRHSERAPRRVGALRRRWFALPRAAAS